jgi:N-acetylglucosamine-6-phosphate deacetylase
MSEDMVPAGRRIDTNEAVILTIEAATIASVRALSAGAADGDSENFPLVSPGFVDIQVNGFQGIDYSGSDLAFEDVERLVWLLGASGTTRHVPTIITNSQERILSNLKTVASAIEGSALVAAAIPGIHVEGPFISPEDGPRGAHDPQFVRDPSVSEYRSWQEASGGRVRMVTLAPERPGALDLIAALVRDGVIPAIGHTAASPEQIRGAVEAGALFSTHLGNGSHAMLPRLKNYLWAQLGTDELAAGVIADGFHVPHEVLKVFLRAKGADRLVLISDVAPPAGLPVGRHKWGNIEVEVHADGHLGLADTEYLAGAGHLLDRCVPQMVAATGMTIATAVSLCTATPARVLGLPEPRIAVGEPADLVLFSWRNGGASGDGVPPLEIEQTFLAGRKIYDAGEE